MPQDNSLCCAEQRSIPFHTTRLYLVTADFTSLKEAVGKSQYVYVYYLLSTSDAVFLLPVRKNTISKLM